MKKKQSSWRNLKSVVTILGALGLMTMVPRDGATQTPVELGVAQPPVITIVFDTSASMQWGGDGTFPTMDYSSDLGIDSNRFHPSWDPRLELNLPGSARRTSSGMLRLLDEDETDGRNVQAIGPCMLWHPTHDDGEDHHCQHYERPPRCGYDDCDYDDHFDSDEQEDLYDHMRSNANFRLNDQTGVPRHIQVKQILTGDLHLRHSDNATPGPGCWMVPRGRGGVGEQICCDELENGRCRADADGNEQFMSFLDASDPVPHIQEVWDVQIENGLMDAMASTAIFSAVMFDGYRYDGVGLGWESPTTDIVAGGSPYSPSADLSATGASGTEDELCDGGPCYDMGFFRFIGPTYLNLNEDEMRAVSSYVQDAILNAGFLFHSEENLDQTRETEDGDVITAPVYPYPLGKQVIGQSTPYGGVFHDLHQFYLNGQYLDRESYEEESTSDVENPFATDPYGACRGRHVVLFTDADEILEVPGGAGDELGRENLDPSFGYLLERYPYMVSEEAIEEMIDATLDQMTTDAEAAIDPRFFPRLHVLSVSNEEEVGDPVLWGRMLDKVGAMAEAGRTCAQYYLPPALVPTGIDTGTKDEDGNYVEGYCDPEGGEVCLVPQNYGPFDYEAPGDDTTFQCEHPALMLTRNDRETLIEAFQLIFNEVARASGLSSRTRPSVTNYLDDDGRQGQYRIFSGLEIGGGVYWKGLLNRQVLDCNDTNGIDGESVMQLHQDMNRLRYENTDLASAELEAMEQNAVDYDRRRVFTSYPRFIKGFNETRVSDKPFGYSFGLFGAESSARDDFGEAEIAQVGEAGEASTRIPFTFESLRDAYVEGVLDGSGDLEDVLDYWGVPQPPGSESKEERFHRIIDRYRARSAARYDRVLGGILNSNPVTVGPPDLDIPIDSYRLFRQRYANRPAMTYVGSVDGQLHAIYTGNPEVVVREAEGGTISDSATGRAFKQREAWAYVPQLLHRRLVETWQAPFQLLDGSPVVQDVRLCHSAEELNTNQRVCPSEEGAVPAVAQWRTVLVQGLGSAPGFFALDVTRPGGQGNPDAGIGGGGPEEPDPLALWEFGPEWEQAQMKEMSQELYRGSGDGDFTCEPITVDLCDVLSVFCDSEEEEISPWEMSFMGMSNAEAAIGSVTVKLSDSVTAQRAVAIFSAGEPGEVEALNPECSQEIIGKALYVVDLQSGALIRRFVVDDTGERFEHPITGTPVLSATQPGQVSSRAFVGDSGGRLLRVDMTNPDPTEWSIGVFYDPLEPPTDFSEYALDPEEYDKEELGSASFRPAVTTLPNRELVIIYGLGQRGETGGDNRLQAVISLKENRESDPPVGEPLWVLPLDPGDEVGMKNERLTGTPVVFNSDVFFTTYVEPEYQCEAGFSRIYRLRYDGIDMSDPDNNGNPIGNWTQFSGATVSGFRIDDADPPKWFGPEEPAMIRGVTVTLGPVCSLDPADADGNRQTASEGQRQAPQLVAAAGTADVSGVGSSMGGGSASGQGDISRLAVDLQPPETRAIPLSWTVIGN